MSGSQVSVKDSKKDSFLEELDNNSIARWFKDAVSESVRYMVLHRCGYAPELDSDVSGCILDFNTEITASILGSAASTLSQSVLREIGVTVKSLERQQSRTFDSFGDTVYNEARKMTKGARTMELTYRMQGDYRLPNLIPRRVPRWASTGFMIISLPAPWIRCAPAAWWPSSPAKAPWIRRIRLSESTSPKERICWVLSGCQMIPSRPLPVREVTSDILFLQKRGGMTDMEPDWVHLDTDGNGLKMNAYFVSHPDMILGEMQEVSGPYGMETACIPTRVRVWNLCWLPLLVISKVRYKP